MLLLLAATAFYVFYWDYIAFAAFLLVLLLPVLGLITTLVISTQITARMEMGTPVISRGQSAVLRLAVENRAFLPVSVAKITLSMRNRFSDKILREALVLPISSRNVTYLDLDVLSDHCGSMVVTVEKIRMGDFFGASFVTKRLDLSGEIAVLPDGFAIEETKEIASAESMESNVYSTRKRGDDSSQVFDYHEYREGDKMKDIHWKLSTKLDRMMVKEYSLPVSSAVRLAVEFAGKETGLGQLDIALEACLSLSAWLSAREASHEIEWFSSENAVAECSAIENQEGLFAALYQLFRIRRYEKPHLLEDILSRTGTQTFSNLIYITTELSEDTADRLLLLRDMANVHVLYAAGDQPVFPAFLHGLGGEHIPVTILRQDTLEEELRNFEL